MKLNKLIPIIGFAGIAASAITTAVSCSNPYSPWPSTETITLTDPAGTGLGVYTATRPVTSNTNYKVKINVNSVATLVPVSNPGLIMATGTGTTFVIHVSSAYKNGSYYSYTTQSYAGTNTILFSSACETGDIVEINISFYSSISGVMFTFTC